VISGEPITCFGSGKAGFAVGRSVLAAKAACKTSDCEVTWSFWTAWFGWFFLAFAGGLGPEKLLILLR